VRRSGAFVQEHGDRLTTDAERTRPRTKKKKFFCSHSHTHRRTSFVVLANPNKSLTHSST